MAHAGLECRSRGAHAVDAILERPVIGQYPFLCDGPSNNRKVRAGTPIRTNLSGMKSLFDQQHSRIRRL
jgi:hypothetical protein